jgi:SAM-dependent methyltransferase
MIRDYDKKQFLEYITKLPESEDIFYGEVNTPFSFIELMLSIIPEKFYKNPDLRWLDPGCGTGNFSIILYYKLLDGLKDVIKDIEERKRHIIEKMIYMVEIQSKNITVLKSIFGDSANIYYENFLDYREKDFDIIIGNPPFNFMGQIKVPTSNSNKKNDGTTIWPEFIIKSISLLKPETGMLCVFIPSIWLKPDKKMMYDYLLQYKIEWLNCFTNTSTNQIFKGKAQTPSCYFLLTKKETDNIITIYDNSIKKYIFYKHISNRPIPIFGQEVCKKIQILGLETLKVIKTNMPPKGVIISKTKTEGYFCNIRTCKLKNNIPELEVDYSNKRLKYAGTPKLVLAHKMYGFPYLDISGNYGISNRDNYVIIKDNISDLIKIQKFLSTNTALYLFETTRYRMKYLEKYAFNIIPDISLLEDFPEEINDDTIAEYFKFDELDKKAINSLHNKRYNFFI